MPQRTGMALAGSHVVHRTGAKRLTPLSSDRRIQATIVLRPQNEGAHDPPSGSATMHPAARQALASAGFRRRYDPGDDAVDRVRAFAQKHGLDVQEVSRARHDVVVEGTPEQLHRAFGVELHEYEHVGGRYYAHDDAIHLPDELTDVVDGVLGLDSVPLHTPCVAVAAAARTQSFTAAQLAQHYRFPSHDAAGVTIALLQFGGGYDEHDLELFAKRFDISLPNVRAIAIRGPDGTITANAPLPSSRMAEIADLWRRATSFAEMTQHAGADLDAFMASLEVTMDIELAAALGGGADVDVYFAPQGADGWRRAIYSAIGEPYAGAPARPGRPPAVISISWGQSESAFGETKLRLIHNSLNAAAVKGVAVCCASGDDGSANTFGKVTSANVNFPASSPAVIAVGGTHIIGKGEGAREVAWKGELLGAAVASGGGMSGFFDRPAWQQSSTFPLARGTWIAPSRSKDAIGRWLPDVAADAAFESGVEIVVGGETLIGGGTSAAAPIWAALLARTASALGHHVADLNAWLYENAHNECCVPVHGGDNDVRDGAIPFYRATEGWNACTGFGRPDGVRLLQALADTAPRPPTPERDRRERPSQPAPNAEHHA